MSELDLDTDAADTESMFDFLAEEGKTRRAPGKPDTERALPIIRKPVPVSESGPLLPPKPGAPVEPPPQLTANKLNAAVNDDLGFLDTEADDSTVLMPPRSIRDTPLTPGSATTIAPPINSASTVTPFRKTVDLDADARLRNDLRDDDLDLDDLDLGIDDAMMIDSDWRAGVATPGKAETVISSGRFRWIASALGVLLMVGGAGLFLITEKPAWVDSVTGLLDNTTEDGMAGAVDVAANGTAPEISSETSPELAANSVPASPLYTRFRAELGKLETLLESGSLDEAEQMLVDMDRTVYGYGVNEFGEIEAKIASIRSGGSLPDNAAVPVEQAAQDEAARLAESQAAEQAAQAEAAQLAEAQAAEQAARAEAAQLAEAQAAEQAARAEAAQLAEAQAAEQAARAEATRLAEARAAEQAALAEAARLAEAQAAEQAARAEAARLAEAQAAEQTARAEAARLAEAQAAARAAQTAAALRQQAPLAVDADRLATDRRIAEERAALQRQEARELRLQQARDRAEAVRLASERAEANRQAEAARQATAQAEQLAARQAAAQQTDTSTAASSSAQQTDNSLAFASQLITDADLQLVYRRFSDLQQAIRDRDINAVVELTQRSGLRIQQFMQMFENSVEIDARIRNVSTRNATGEIDGTLQIKMIRRADGSETIPPPNLASVRLSSVREPTGWSAIRW